MEALILVATRVAAVLNPRDSFDFVKAPVAADARI